MTELISIELPNGETLSPEEYREALPERLAEGIEASKHEYTDKDLERILGKTIKGDMNVPKILFIGLNNNYTEDGQDNYSLTEKSSGGKTWTALQTVSFFPKEDVEKIGYASPTSFYYRYGEYDEEKRVRVVDLRQKIIVWLDQPHFKLLEKLRPLLSKDEPEISYQVTNKSKRGDNRQLSIIIKGYFSTVFCSAYTNMSGQERTRLVQLSPDVSPETLRASIEQVNEIEADPTAFWKAYNEDPEVINLRQRITDLKHEQIKYVIIPDDLSQKILDDFNDKRPDKRARHRRDLKHLYALIKGYALINFVNREKTGQDIIATKEDVENGIRLYESIRESTEAGVSIETYSLFTKIIHPTGEHGINKKEIRRTYYAQHKERIGEKRLRNMLEVLVDTGLIEEKIDPDDKRRKIYNALDGGTHQTIEINDNTHAPPHQGNHSLDHYPLTETSP